jgi:hypothetical protein
MNENVIHTRSDREGAGQTMVNLTTTTTTPTLDSSEDCTLLSGAKRKRGDDEDEKCILKNHHLRSLLDIKTVLKDVPTILTPPDDPSFTRQIDYLSTFHRSIVDDGNNNNNRPSWENLAGAISYFLSYHMVRKIYGEDSEGQRSAARAMYNLIHHCKTNELVITHPKNNKFSSSKEVNYCDALLKYTKSLAAFPHEKAIELQKLWETFYWEKKEVVYPYLRKSKFTLEPGDTFTKEVVDGKEEEEEEEVVVIKESDMIMTQGDINSKCGGCVGIYLAVARVCGVLFNNRGCGASTTKHRVRGEYITIYTGRRPKEEAAWALEEYRVTGRNYEQMLIDEYGGRIQIAKVCKNGWYMKPEGMFGGGAGVFVPLTAKVAKMGVAGTVFSGMRLGLAGGIWRPLPSGQTYDHTICYNVYPPGFHDFQSE